MITTTEIEKLASLSRIAVTAEEKELLRKDIESILSYVAKVQAHAGEAVVPPLSAHRNIFREDKDSHESGLYTEALLAAAPQSEKGYVVVKKIL